MRRTLTWLVTLPFAAASVLIGHAIAYRITGTSLPSNSRMNSNVSVDFRNKPLIEVVDELRTLSQTNMLLEAFALEYAGVDPKMPISVTLNNVTLRTVLDRVLSQAQLTYYVKDGVINITTREARSSHNCVAVTFNFSSNGSASAVRMAASESTVSFSRLICLLSSGTGSNIRNGRFTSII